MPDHGRDRAIAKRRHQPQRVPHGIQQAKRPQAVVVAHVPAGGAAIAAQVRRDDMVAGGGEQRHDLAPGIRQFGEAMQQQNTRAIGCFEAGFQHMDLQTVDVGDEARAQPWRQCVGVQWWQRCHGSLRRCAHDASPGGERETVRGGAGAVQDLAPSDQSPSDQRVEDSRRRTSRVRTSRRSRTFASHPSSDRLDPGADQPPPTTGLRTRGKR